MRSRLVSSRSKGDCFSACGRIPAVDERPGGSGLLRECPKGEQRMSRRIAVAGGASLAAAIVLSVIPARAETLYFGGEGGWTLLQNQKISPSGLPSGTERFNSGYAAGARIGYEEGSWRFEAEYAYRHNGADSITFGGANIANVGGSRQAHAFLANLIYE